MQKVQVRIMNKVILMGRLTRDPEMRNSNGESNTAIARYTLAVDRRYKREGEAGADFISCVAFGRSAEKYFRQGLKVVITGRIQTGSYTNRDGNKVYTTDVVVEDQEFAESKAAAQRNREESSQERMEPMPVDENGFMTLPEDFDEELPFA